MKIYSVEIVTDLGRRVVQFSPPLDVDLRADMPAPVRTLPDLLWGVLRRVAEMSADLMPAKVEA